jgi:hypothetical protein
VSRVIHVFGFFVFVEELFFFFFFFCVCTLSSIPLILFLAFFSVIVWIRHMRCLIELIEGLRRVHGLMAVFFFR